MCMAIFLRLLLWPPSSSELSSDSSFSVPPRAEVRAPSKSTTPIKSRTWCLNMFIFVYETSRKTWEQITWHHWGTWGLNRGMWVYSEAEMQWITSGDCSPLITKKMNAAMEHIMTRSFFASKICGCKNCTLKMLYAKGQQLEIILYW